MKASMSLNKTDQTNDINSGKILITETKSIKSKQIL